MMVTIALYEPTWGLPLHFLVLGGFHLVAAALFTLFELRWRQVMFILLVDIAVITCHTLRYLYLHDPDSPYVKWSFAGVLSFITVMRLLSELRCRDAVPTHMDDLDDEES